MNKESEMGEVKRYDLDQLEEGWATMQPYSHGDYVTWEDYCKLLEENAELVRRIRLLTILDGWLVSRQHMTQLTKP